MPPSTDLLQGTLDLLILQTLALEPMHGWGVAQRIQHVSRDVFQIGQGSLYPALYRLEYKGWIRSDWGNSENNRRAKFYRLTAAGRKTTGDGTRNLGSIVGCYCACIGPRRGGVIMISEFLTRLRFLILRKKRSELDDEIRFHLSRRLRQKRKQEYLLRKHAGRL